MKRKLATVTPEIYNSLDLIVGSPEFNQVGAVLIKPHSGALTPSFLGSDRGTPFETSQ